MIDVITVESWQNTLRFRVTSQLLSIVRLLSVVL